MCTVLGCFKQPTTVHTMICSHFYSEYEMTARNDQVTICQSKPDFASGKYGYWRKSASLEKSKVQALTGCFSISANMPVLVYR